MGLSESAVELWNDWQLRSMILISLWLQIFLTITGSQRKNTAGIWLGMVVWLAYSSADWLATLSLGTLARSQGGSESNGTTTNASIIPAFWAPMLLVHLGGPDTITAFAVEDNELWSRHVLQLLTQLAMSFYASLRSWWSKDPLLFVVIPIFVSGIIKYGERVWILWSVSSNKFRDSANKERKLLREQIDQQFASGDFDNTTRRDEVLGFKDIIREAKHLHEGHFLFRILKLLYGDYLVTFPTHMITYHILKGKSATEAFKLIAVELGFMFDVLFTKVMTGVCWQARFILRGFNFIVSVSALLTFWLMTRNSHAYSEINITISYLLLGGAIVLEIYSVIWMLFSDWAMLWLSKQRKPLADSIYRYIYSSRLLSALIIHKKRWKESMDQHAIHKQMTPMANIFSTDHNFKRWKEDVDIDLKESIFNHLLDKRSRYSRQDNQKMILAERGDQALRSKECLEKFGWSVVDIDFHESLLLWHAATYFCHKGHMESSEVKISTSLASYMLYLRSDLPFMLPKEMGEAKYKSTSTEAALMGIEEGQVEGSVLSDGRKLASALDSLEAEAGWSDEKKWEMIAQVWVEMLTFAAVHCGWKEHTKALTRGGELLTFVAILMSHLGINEQCMYK